MALQDYLTLQQDVADILIQYGTTFKLSRPTNNNGVITDKTLASLIFGTMDNQLQGYFNTTNGGIIALQHKTVYLTPIGTIFAEPNTKVIDIQVGDRLIDASKNNWRVVNVELFRPDNTTIIAYQIQVT